MDGIHEPTFVRVTVLDSDIEAQLLASILDEQEIPYRMRSYHDTAYDGLFQVQKGWGEISAPEDFREQILEIIRDIRENRPDE